MSAHEIPYPPSPRSARPSCREVAEMSLERFSRAGLVVKVHSKLLEETVLFASDNAVVPQSPPLRVLRAADLVRLLGRRPGKRRIGFRSVA